MHVSSDGDRKRETRPARGVELHVDPREGGRPPPRRCHAPPTAAPPAPPRRCHAPPTAAPPAAP
jgi:hypothetical protein